MKRAFTLVELLISIAIGGIIAGVIILILNIGILSWKTGEADILIQDVGQKILDEIVDGRFEYPGIRECVEIVEARENYVGFVPLWVDEYEIGRNMDRGAAFRLKKKLSPGSPIPLAEIKDSDDRNFRPVRISFSGDSRESPGDAVRVNAAIRRGSKLKVIYHPDACDPGVLVSYLWNGETGMLIRNLLGDVQEIPVRSRGVKVTKLSFEYFDSTNAQIPLSSNLSENQLRLINAVKVILYAEKGDEKRELSSFVNIRNISNRGRGIPLTEGSVIEIPDSENIQSLVLTNIGGVENGDIIEFEARPQKGDVWKLRVKFGLMPEASGEEKPRLLNLSVEYPEDRILWSRFINRPVEHGLNLTDFGNNLYDYDDDAGVDDVVNLSGKVELVVTRMDVDAAAIAIQP